MKLKHNNLMDVHKYISDRCTALLGEYETLPDLDDGSHNPRKTQIFHVVSELRMVAAEVYKKSTAELVRYNLVVKLTTYIELAALFALMKTVEAFF